MWMDNLLAKSAVILLCDLYFGSLMFNALTIGQLTTTPGILVSSFPAWAADVKAVSYRIPLIHSIL